MVFSTELTFTFQQPALLIIVVLAGLVAVRLEFFIFRAMGVKGATPGKRRAAAWLTVIILTAAPLPVLRVIAFLVLVSAVLQAGAGLALMGTKWGRRTVHVPRIRSRLRIFLGSVRALSPLAERPWVLRTWAKGLEDHGFAALAEGEQSEGVSRVILFRSSDGVIASLLWQPTRWLDALPLPFVQLISPVEDRAGALSTSVGFGPDVCQILIPQVVSLSTTPGNLLRRHEEGRCLLEARGIRFDVIPAVDAFDEMGRFWEEMVLALLRLPPDSLLLLRPRLRRRSVFLASTLEHPDVVERIERVRIGAAQPGVPGTRMP